MPRNKIKNRIRRRNRRKLANRGLKAPERLEDRRLMAAGALDPTFGFYGLLRQDIDLKDEALNGLATYTDGVGNLKTVAVGYIEDNADGDQITGRNTDFLVMRYNEDGSLDTSFGNGGIVTTDFNGGHDIARSVAIQDDGKIVVVGIAENGSDKNDFAVARYLPDGSLDRGFSGDGKKLIDFYSKDDSAWDVAIYGDKIIVGGSTTRRLSWINQKDFAAVRLRSNGALDTGFSGDGKQVVDFRLNLLKFPQDDEARSLVVKDDGSIVLGGYTTSFNGNGLDLALTSLTSSGKVDTKFGIFGKSYRDFSGYDDFVEDMALDAEGRLVTALTFTTKVNGVKQTDIGVARWTTKGLYDLDFGTLGVKIYDPYGLNDGARSVALQEDGKILVGGAIGIPTAAGPRIHATVLRLTERGSFDRSFGIDGAVVIGFGREDQVGGITVQPDGKIMAVGAAIDPLFGQFDVVATRLVNDLPDRFESPTSNNARYRATRLDASGGEIEERWLSIHRSSDTDWYRFDTTGTSGYGNYVQVDYVGAPGDVDLRVEDQSGNLVGKSRGGSDRERVSLAGWPADTYYVRVEGNAENTDYSLSLNVPRKAVADRFESPQSNDSSSTAKRITNRVETDLSIHKPAGEESDVDWYRFTLSERGGSADFARIDFSHGLGDLNMMLYNAAGGFVGQSTGFGDREQVSLSGLPAGEYQLAVYAPQGGTNAEYTLTIDRPGAVASGDRFEPNSIRARAANLGEVGGMRIWSAPDTLLSIQDSNDVDWYRFDLADKATSENYVGIAFDHDAGDLSIELYDDPKASAPVAVSAGVRDGEFINLDGAKPGTYFLKVSGQANPEYALLLNAPGGDWAETHGAESNNNSRTKAFDLRKVEGFQSWGTQGNPLSIDKGGDRDYYKFELAQTGKPGHYARIDFNHAAGDVNLRLLDSNGALLDGSKTAGNVESVSLASREPGVYYLRVDGLNGSTNPAYTISIDAPKPLQADWAERHDSVSNNNTTSTAFDLGALQGQRIVSNQVNPLSIHSGDKDVFKFELTERATQSHFATIAFRHAEGDLDLRLLDRTGREIVRPGGTGVGNSHTISLAGLGPDVYYLEVGG
ncbi:MAG: pre-peptidase C-terminal domain-containing protein, partial [Pirellulales bacterium]